MAININDDYDKLVKLFYPSLEASGNIYYGQTRKLTMDEILGKNDMGFESHIESEKQNNEYCKFFNWKIGPLHGAVRVGDLETFPLAYAKYKLVITNRTVENHLNSASFPTYENEIACIFDSIAYTTGNPVDESESWDGRHFYVDDSGTDKYLYIALVDYYSNEDEYSDLKEMPLCFVCKSSDAVIQLNAIGSAFTCSYEYFLDTGNATDSWQPYTIGDTVHLSTYNKVYFKGHRDSQDINNRIYFTITKSDNCFIDVMGNINSLLDENKFSLIDDLSQPKTPNGYSIGEYTFLNLFRNSTIDTAHYLIMPSKTASKWCYMGMFEGCASLVLPPIILMSITDYACCNSMFYGCTLLSRAPDLNASKLSPYCYQNMFSNCSNLKFVRCNALDTSSQYCLHEWLDNSHTNGAIYCKDSFSDSYIPDNWLRYNYDEDEPLTIVAVHGTNISVTPDTVGYYDYRLNYDGEWDILNNFVTINISDAVELRAHNSNISFYRRIAIDGDSSCVSAAYGNICSVIDSVNFKSLYRLPEYSLQDIFLYNESLVRPPSMKFTVCYDYGCESAFKGCTQLTRSPKLYSVSVGQHGFESMFDGCTSLVKAPTLKASVLNQSCYKNMFAGCSNLKSVTILASDVSTEDSLNGWLDGVSSTGTLYYNSKAGDISLFNKPSVWTAKDLYEEIKEGEEDEEKTSIYRSQYMITSGSDSDQNGKGKLDGDGNYESSFDVNGNHPMGSYNKDGSYNQEIWGYKSFNSPVQFRNGIYGDSKGLYISGNTKLSGNLDIVGTVTATNFEIPDMSSRFVTTYNKDDQSIGDDQTILGVKTFRNNISSPNISCNSLTASEINPNSSVSRIGSSENSYTVLYTNVTYTHNIGGYGSYSAISLNNNLLPAFDENINLGSDSRKYYTIYTEELRSTALYSNSANISNILTDSITVNGLIDVSGGINSYGGIHGIAPVTNGSSGEVTLLEGAVILVMCDSALKSALGGESSYRVGTRLNIQINSNVYIATLNSSTGSYTASSDKLPAGYYRLVSSVDFSNIGTNTAVLLQKG